MKESLDFTLTISTSRYSIVPRLHLSGTTSESELCCISNERGGPLLKVRAKVHTSLNDRCIANGAPRICSRPTCKAVMDREGAIKH